MRLVKMLKPTLTLLLLLSAGTGMAAAAEKLNYPELSNTFYKKKGIFWTAPENISLCKRLVSLVDKSANKGLDKRRFHPAVLHAFMKGKASGSEKEIELYFSDAAITYCRDLLKAPQISKWLSYDDVTQKHPDRDDNVVMRKLLELRNETNLKELIASFEPNDIAYEHMVSALTDELKKEPMNTEHVNKISTTLAYYRWIHHFNFDKYIVVNIASAKLRYYENREQVLSMKVVAGDSPTETPRFAAHCNQLTLYPYWHVPRSIAIREILPFCKENEKDLADLDLQVLDRSGNIVDPTKLNWKKFNANNFPYNFRHVPGCDNPLGLIKFNLTDPFDIYLHDTNLKRAFKSKKRFYSHGCVRLEQPVELANLFLDEKLSEDFLNDCKENERPRIKSFKPVPVFVVYMPAEVLEPGSVTLYNDVYKLL